MNPNAAWRVELTRRLIAILESLKAGDDATPAARLKAEGFAEAGLVMGLVSVAELACMLDESYRQVLGATVGELFPFSAADCVDATNLQFRLPVRWQRAPVYVGSGGSSA
jgi:hypothetical protein